MVLVDTSVWVDHFRKGNAHLKELLTDGDVVCHPFIIGALALGSLKNRREILSLLNELSQPLIASDEEVLDLIERRRLMGWGIGLVDVHLLASSMLSKVPLWTLDKRLEKTAAKLGVLY